MDESTQWKPELYNQRHSYVYQYGEALIEFLDPQKDQRILDLGCGSGQLTFLISQLAKKVVGIDKSAEMIADAKAKFPDLEFQVANASDFQFKEKFDSIFSNATLHWVKDFKGAITCMYRNLKTDGKIVLEFGAKGNVETLVNQLRNSLKRRGYSKQAALDLWYFPTIGEYAIELEAVGFKVRWAEQYDRPTELADEHSGIKDWISMFGEHFLVDVSEKHKEEIKHEVQEKVKE